MDPVAWLRKRLDEDGSDLLAEMIRSFAEQLMDAEAQGLCGAGYGEVSPQRVNFRNGSRFRELETRAGTIELAIPKLRRGIYFPEWLLEPCRRAEQALTQVVCQCYVEGSPPGALTTLSRPSASKA
jgi:transposase-like protein